ncbi:MAG: class I SAM-dependent methyltransferase [Betaproteobacteria bacterium]
MSDTTPAVVQEARSLAASAYDTILYVGQPYANTHPDRLATLAILHGIEPAAVGTCRVLEIGCGDGANIVPMAATLPSAEFVGIDYAARPVALALQMVQDLGLRNITISQLDLCDLPADAGTFDYIIVHGLYSWVPLEVRQQVMPVIARHLAPNGIAYVSYNLFPGCRVRQTAWEMLKLHTRDCPDLPSKIVAARELISLMADSKGALNRDEDTLRAEFRKLAHRPDGSLSHDDLNDNNNPVYFQEFVADAGCSGLAFLAEADLFSMTAGDFLPNVREMLGRMDRLTREQYLDFLRFRPFRCSLLCHASALPEFNLHPERVIDMHASPAHTLRHLIASGKEVRYQDDYARYVVERLLARWPESVPVSELIAIPEAGTPQLDRAIAESAGAQTRLLELCIAGVLDLRLRAIRPASAATLNPVVFGPARWTCNTSEIVPNLYHEGIRLGDAIARRLVTLLDGTRTRADLMLALDDACAGPDGAEQLENAIAGLANRALLVA